MKRLMTLITSLAMVIAMSATSFAASISQDDALNIALADAGLNAGQIVGLEAEPDDGKYEIEFINTGNNAEYSYDISASSGKIIEKNIDFAYSKNTSRKKISKKSARKKAAAITGVKYKTVRKGSIKYKYKKHQGRYTVKFKSGGYRYEVDIQAPTGAIMELEMDAVKK